MLRFTKPHTISLIRSYFMSGFLYTFPIIRQVLTLRIACSTYTRIFEWILLYSFCSSVIFTPFFFLIGVHSIPPGTSGAPWYPLSAYMVTCASSGIFSGNVGGFFLYTVTSCYFFLANDVSCALLSHACSDFKKEWNPNS